MIRAFFRNTKTILDMIKFEHTIFAMPFALISVLLASYKLPGHMPSGHALIWIVLAMVGARSAAMAFNRIADADIDAQNPRTSRRAIPAGILNKAQVWLFFFAAVALFECAAYNLNRLCFLLSPVVLAALVGYSYTKRFTSLCHLFLGFTIGIAPIGAWIAIRGSVSVIPILLGAAVMLWIGGFDIIYALQDLECDKQLPIFSLPKAVGAGPALTISRVMHLVMVVLLWCTGRAFGLHTIYFVGVAVVAALVLYEQSLVKPTDLRRVDVAFFTLNGWVSMSLLAFVFLDVLMAR